MLPSTKYQVRKVQKNKKGKNGGKKEKRLLCT
jgi:hypothetical protein